MPHSYNSRCFPMFYHHGRLIVWYSEAAFCIVFAKPCKEYKKEPIKNRLSFFIPAAGTICKNVRSKKHRRRHGKLFSLWFRRVSHVGKRQRPCAAFVQKQILPDVYHHRRLIVWYSDAAFCIIFAKPCKNKKESRSKTGSL